MFSNLRIGNQVYVLHKNATPYIEMGIVESIPNMTMMGYYPNLSGMPMDIVIKIGERVIPFKGIPSNAEVADSVEQNSNEKVSIACSKDAVNGEIQSLRQASLDAINSVEYHKQRVSACDNLLNQLNPEVVEKAKQAEEINDLKSQVMQLSQALSTLNEQLKKETSSSKSKKE